MLIESGIELLGEKQGTGTTATKGDRVIFNLRIYLNKGDEVSWDDKIISVNQLKKGFRVLDNKVFIDHEICLGTRQIIAGIEKTLCGMKPEGYRKVRISPHLAYRDKGIPGLIPANAVLIAEIWLRDVQTGRR